jgi:hypothetical protein
MEFDRARHAGRLLRPMPEQRDPLSITGVNPRVQELLRLTGMEKVLPIASTQKLTAIVTVCEFK